MDKPFYVFQVEYEVSDPNEVQRLKEATKTPTPFQNVRRAIVIMRDRSHTDFSVAIESKLEQHTELVGIRQAVYIGEAIMNVSTSDNLN
jgi:hypothetical protein